MKTIALVGENGCGKGLFIEVMKKLLPHKRIVSVRFSDVLSDILDILGIEKSRDNIDTLVTTLRSAFHDEGLLTAALRKRLQNMDADIVILDGLRKEKEVPLVHEREGLLVYIAVDEKIRFERLSQRTEKSDEAGMTWEQFVEQSKADPQVQIRHIGETMANATLNNNGSLDEFEVAVKEFIAEHGL
ncbi:MAG: hypothetical protein Q8R30_01570 [bacterium]|nr:hypothetical protein [bacterium]